MKGITFEDYQDFFQVLRSIQDIATALKFYSIAGASIDKEILKHVSKTVANVDLKDHVIDVVFTLFDENGFITFIIFGYICLPELVSLPYPDQTSETDFSKSN